MAMDILKDIMKTMKATGTTQADLVRLTGIRQHRLSEYLNGRRDMTAANVQKILTALGLELRPSSRKAKG